MRLRRKLYTYTKHVLIGAIGGSGVGAGVNLYRNRNNKSNKLRAAMSGATIGAGVGAGLGAAAKYGRDGYRKFIGVGKIKKII